VTFAARLIVVMLAAFGVANVVGSIALALLWRQPVGSAAARATALFQHRLIPLAGSLLAAFLGVCAFARFEPRVGQERTSLLLLLLATATFGAVSLKVLAFAREQLAVRRALREWLTTAERLSLDHVAMPAYVVASAFPIVAVIGLFRPRLIVARVVLESCSADELNAILAHERCHVRSRDNVRRTVLGAVPDVVSWLPLSRRINELWHVAAEEAADDAAAQSATAGRLHLAEALLRVAQLAAARHAPAYLPASALYRGENIERRVRRVLDPTLDLAAVSDGPHWLMLSAGSLLGLSLLALRPIHKLVEAAVSYLP
jgi:hypothetical protein